MRKFNLVALMLVAFAAFLAVSVSSASAAEHLLWLVNGTDFTGTLTAETEGDLILVRLLGGVVKNRILCEGILDGNVTNAGGVESTDEITKVLTLAQVDVGNDGATLTGNGLACTVLEDPTNEGTACKVGSKVTVWPANLPWATTLELMTATEWLDKLTGPAGKAPGYEVLCEESLIFFSGEELCEGNTSALVLETLESWPGTVALGSHSEFGLTISEAGSCGAEAGVAELEGLGVTWITEGELNRLETDVSETLL